MALRGPIRYRAVLEVEPDMMFHGLRARVTVEDSHGKMCHDQAITKDAFASDDLRLLKHWLDHAVRDLIRYLENERLRNDPFEALATALLDRRKDNR